MKEEGKVACIPRREREITLHVAFLVMGSHYPTLFVVGGYYKGIVTIQV